MALLIFKNFTLKRSLFSDLGQAGLHLFFPNNCTLCSDPLTLKETFFCLHCKQQFPFIYSNSQAKSKMYDLFKGRITVKDVQTLFQYLPDNPTRLIPHQIKYNNKQKLAVHMGEQMGKHLVFNSDIDIVVPLPLHPRKKRERGYNQSELLVNGFCKITAITQNNSNLIRKKHTKSQTKFSKYDRWENVRSIFAVKDQAQFEGKHILIIDDVLTTGATLESAAAEILKIPNTKVSLATLAARL